MTNLDVKSSAAALAALLLVVSGCDERRTEEDAGRDAGEVTMDGGGMDDAGRDAGGGDPDGGSDAGSDGGGEPDGGGTGDAGSDGGMTMVGGGAATSAQIQAARDAADGTATLPIDDAVVTYVKPATGSETAGFFVQAEQTGPALFIAVDPATLTPTPAVGDVVSFQIDAMATVDGHREAMTISGLAVASSGHDVSFLAQEVSTATDLVSALDSYESELIMLTATAAADFTFAGGGHESAPIDTAGITGNTELRLRVPSTLSDALDLVQSCDFAITGVMWRFNTQAQPSIYRSTEISITRCPAPTVVGAVATSPTEVRVSFDRQIDPASITDAATQITFTGGLTASAASVSGRDVIVTTSAQVGGMAYDVTVANSVTDFVGSGVDTGANTASFFGYLDPAVVRINELNANIGGGCDLIELRVVSAGTMDGFELRERTTTLLTFPPGFTVATNDLIVVHMNGGSGACNGGGAAAPANETTAPDAIPASAVSTNYDTAFDFYSTDSGLTATDNVFALLDGAGTYVDAVFASDAPTGTAAADSETAAADAAAAGEWTTTAGTVPATGFVDEDFNAHAVQDLNGTGTTAAGDSIQRSDDLDSNSMTGWTQVASSFGAINAGQTAF